MPATLLAAIAWIQAISQLYTAGKGAVDEVKAVMRQHGIDLDNATLDAIAADADIRKAREDALIDPPTSPV